MVGEFSLFPKVPVLEAHLALLAFLIRHVLFSLAATLCLDCDDIVVVVVAVFLSFQPFHRAYFHAHPHCLQRKRIYICCWHVNADVCVCVSCGATRL